MGLFHIVPEEKSRKIPLTFIESQILPNLPSLDVDSQISQFEWTMHNGRRKFSHKIQIRYQKRIELIEYRRHGNQ